MQRAQVLTAAEGELGRARLRQRTLAGQRDEGVKAAVEPRDPVEQRLGQRDRAERAGADLRGEPGDGFEGESGIGHASALRCGEEMAAQRPLPEIER